MVQRFLCAPHKKQSPLTIADERVKLFRTRHVLQHETRRGTVVVVGMADPASVELDPAAVEVETRREREAVVIAGIVVLVARAVDPEMVFFFYGSTFGNTLL